MRRATTFCAGLCLNRGKPEVALEMLSDVRKPNYVTIRNIKVQFEIWTFLDLILSLQAQAFAQLGRLEEAIVLLKSVISEDEPGQISHTFSKDVVEAVKSVVSNTDNPEMTLEFSKLENLLVKEGHISDTVNASPFVTFALHVYFSDFGRTLVFRDPATADNEQQTAK